IDVDSETGSLPYGIPGDNPFVGQEGARDEIWAYGLRNPWGLYFDKEGRFWCADVGQNLYEEINIIEKGGNYGWSFREGMHEFVINPNKPVNHALFGEPEFVEPIFEYGRTVGLSITGGFIYEGSALPELAGKYIYGDFNFGTIWALEYDFEKKEATSNEILWSRVPKEKKGQRWTGFYPTAEGEVYALDWHGGIYLLSQLK
ncbi:MAG: PQQ-dependent sugar dehydrogenase, partial [Verrucomicrobiota bacterium]